jgi:hypothetical protein
MLSFLNQVALAELEIATVNQTPTVRRTPSVVMAATMAADVMAVEVTANAAAEAMSVVVVVETIRNVLANPVRPCVGFKAHARSFVAETDAIAQMDHRK